MKISWQTVHAMSEAQLEQFATEHKVDMDKDFRNLTHAADHVCAELLVGGPAKTTVREAT